VNGKSSPIRERQLSGEQFGTASARDGPGYSAGFNWSHQLFLGTSTDFQPNKIQSTLSDAEAFSCTEITELLPSTHERGG
jgi:hypothetical protein